MIPRVIHQTYSSFADIPPAIHDGIVTTHANNPTWEYRFYDDDAVAETIRTGYGQDMLQTYMRINPAYGAARADLFRYLLMYEQGGVYLDIKSGTTTSLDSIIRPADQYLLSHWEKPIWYPELIRAGVHRGLELQQ